MKPSLALGIALTALSALAVSSASAASLGVANGDLIVHFNNPPGTEVPSNASYISINNATFNFDPNLAFPTSGYGPNHFFQAIPNQFTFNLVFNLPTNTGPSPAAILAANGNANGTIQTVNADWAITDPNFGSIGNSPFRGGNGNGSSITYAQTVTPTATGFTMELYGQLVTDGKIHWATSTGGNLDGTSNLNDLFTQFFFPNDGKLYFHSVLNYTTATDTTAGADTYSGTTLFATTPFTTPLPNAGISGLVLCGLLAGGLKLRKHFRAA